MHLTRATNYAVRLSISQISSGSNTVEAHDRLVLPFAFLLAGIGLGLSSFSLKQLLASRGRRGL